MNSIYSPSLFKPVLQSGNCITAIPIPTRTPFCHLNLTLAALFTIILLIKGPASASEKIPPDLKIHIEKLRTLDGAKLKQTAADIEKNKAYLNAHLSHSLRNESNLKVAMQLTQILGHRGHRFSDLSEVSTAVKAELKKRCGALTRTENPTTLASVIKNILAFDNAAAPLLLTVLNNRKLSDSIRYKSACTLAHMNRTDGLPLLIHALGDEDANFWVQTYILSLKGQASKALQSLGLKSSNPVVRQHSAQLLGWLGHNPPGARLESVFIKGIGDQNKNVSLAHIIALVNIASPDSFESVLTHLYAGKINDRFAIHAAAVALAKTVTHEKLPLLLKLLRSKNTSFREVAIVSLGLSFTQSPESPELSQAINSALIPLLDHGSTRLQKRAIEAVGKRMNQKKLKPSLCIGRLSHWLHKGQVAIRYAAALGLGEAIFVGAQLPPETEALAKKTLGIERLGMASGACGEALLSVFEKNAAQTGLSGFKPLAPKQAGAQEKVTTAKDAKSTPTEPTQPNSKNEGQQEGSSETVDPYRKGFKWGDKSKAPITEFKQTEKDKPAPKEAPSGQTETPTQENSTPDSSDTDSTQPDSARAQGAGNLFGGVPPGLAGQRRHRLEAITNPCKPGKLVFMGYLRVN